MYPGEERLKNLEEKVKRLTDALHQTLSIEDKVFHGIVADIEIDTTCSAVYLKVARYQPFYDSMGNLWFDNDSDHPMEEVGEATEAEKPYRYDSVYVLNAPREMWSYYFPIGTRIKYWKYSGTDNLSATIRGSYVTIVEDPSFWGHITVLASGSGSGSGGGGSGSGSGSGSGGCTPFGPYTLTASQYSYSFTAVKLQQSITTLSNSWTAQVCGSSSLTEYEGTAYNLNDVFAPTGAAVPEGIVRIYPVLITDYTTCTDDMWQYWFTPGGGGGMIPVSLIETSGSNGSDVSVRSWVYTAYPYLTSTGTPLGTGLSPVMRPNENGYYTAGTVGFGFTSGGTFVLAYANEAYGESACSN